MKPRLDPLDIIVAIGMFATIVGGLFLVFASYANYGGGLTSSAASDGPFTTMRVMQGLQTGMGENIVELAKVDLVFQSPMDRVTKSLTSVTGSLQAISQRPGIPETVQARFEQAKAGHDARIQYLMGKSIVTLTGQGMRAGVLSAQNLHNNPFNQRIINTARGYGALGEGRFNNSQAILGQWISEESRSRQRSHAYLQERTGQFIVQKASMEHAYQTAKSDLQSQLHALTAAATRTQSGEVFMAALQPSDRSSPASLSVGMAQGKLQISPSSFWNDIPIGIPIAFLILLPALLIMGLTIPRNSLEKPVNMERILELTMELMPRTPIRTHHG
jgi:hypothetical protein